MSRPKSTNGNGANLGFEARLWQTADALRNNMDAAENEHPCAHPELGCHTDP
jgi:type I restriction enzyme M protein